MDLSVALDRFALRGRDRRDQLDSGTLCLPLPGDAKIQLPVVLPPISQPQFGSRVVERDPMSMKRCGDRSSRRVQSPGLLMPSLEVFSMEYQDRNLPFSFFRSQPGLPPSARRSRDGGIASGRSRLAHDGQKTESGDDRGDESADSNLAQVHRAAFSITASIWSMWLPTTAPRNLPSGP